MPAAAEKIAPEVKPEINQTPLMLILALAACALVNCVFNWLIVPRNNGDLDIHPAPSAAVETAAFLGLGMRRMAADLDLIRLLIYYGTQEEGLSHRALENGGGSYAEIGPRARQILDLDPHFSYVALYAGGSLAFNLDRPQEALDLLQYALKRDPGNVDYRALIGAIGFEHQQSAPDVIRLLEPLLLSPDCPTMIKSMLAFLYVKQDMPDKARAVYRDIMATSRDQGYHNLARQMLVKLGAPQ